VVRGLRRHFATVALQALRLAYALLDVRVVVASPLTKGNKKSTVPPHPRCLGSWPTTPSVDSLKSCTSISVRAS
jgi:hypothetical protein